MYVCVDISALQSEISGLEEVSRQLFVEYVDMRQVKVIGGMIIHCMKILKALKSLRFSQLMALITCMFVLQDRMLYSATLKGIYFDIVGRFFSLYCIYKIFIVSVFHRG